VDRRIEPDKVREVGRKMVEDLRKLVHADQGGIE